jgi:hypothetical protein
MRARANSRACAFSMLLPQTLTMTNFNTLLLSARRLHIRVVLTLLPPILSRSLVSYSCAILMFVCNTMMHNGTCTDAGTGVSGRQGECQWQDTRQRRRVHQRASHLRPR